MDSIKQKNLLQTELWNFTKKLRRLSVNEELGTSVYNFIIFKAWKKALWHSYKRSYLRKTFVKDKK